MGLLIFFGVIGSIALIVWLNRRLSDLREKAEKYVNLKPKLDDLDNYSKQLELKEYQLQSKQMKWEKKAQHDREALERKTQAGITAIETLANEKTEGFPWLAEAYADYLYVRDLKKVDYLAYKPHPALRAAEQVREVASQRRVAEKLYRILKYKLEYYENLFPWLLDFTGDDIDDLIRQIMERKQRGKEEIYEPDDPAKKWLTQAEYSQLPTVEKYQLALDRYWQKKKTRWEIGRDYERYIGYLYEVKGYGVHYQGIVEGLADLGRDLICTQGDNAEIIQCKRWSKDKQIHEKHIFQLYGTAVAYRIDHPDRRVSSCFVTTTILSDRAKQFAQELRIKTLENYPLNEHYPCIKCNVSKRDETKIYHLPFDQQYDRTIVEEERNECYVETVKDAEELGFRRAFRWHGEANSLESI